MLVRLKVAIALLLAAVMATPATAQVIAQSLTAGATSGGYLGQSFTPIGNGAYTGITFNFYDGDTGVAAAPGQLSIYTVALAAPGDIGSAANLVGRSLTNAGGIYTFDPGMTLNGGTIYYAFTDVYVPSLRLATNNPYSGGAPLALAASTGGAAAIVAILLATLSRSSFAPRLVLLAFWYAYLSS